MVDQNSQFYAILTNVGAAKQANADALGIAWKITHMGVGDANGTDPTPNANQASLINEWRRAPLNQLKVDDKNSAIIVAEQVIPADVGGRWIREIALYDADGDMVAVANCAPTYKPLLSQGSGRTQVVRMNLIVSSSSNVELKIDPSVVLATREWVAEELAKQDFKHSVLAATTGNIALSGLQTIDEVVLFAGARVLVKNQVAAKDNGLYTVAVGAWTRCTDADVSAKVTPGMLVLVERGTVNGDSAWQLLTNAPITLGVTALAFEMAFGRTGVAENTYRSVTVDKYGRVVAATNPTTVAGYGLTDVYTKTQIDQALALKAPLASPALTGVPTAPTAPAGTNTAQLANTAFVQAAIAALVDSSPGALDTLNELAAALGDDPNFATTMTNALALKAPLASPTFTGDPKAPTPPVTDNDLSIATTEFVRKYTAQYGLAEAAFPQEVDLNKYLTPGNYLTPAGGLKNVPPGWDATARRYNILVGGVNATGAITQILIAGMSGEAAMVAVRSYSAMRVWTDWVELWTSGNTPKQKNPLDQTVGAMLVPGSFGIGRAILSDEPDLNKYLIPGNYLTPIVGLLNLPPGWNPAHRYSLVVEGYTSFNYLIQRITGGMATGHTPIFATRVMQGENSWTPWQFNTTNEHLPFRGVKVFKVPGVFTWEVPEGVKKAWVTVVGGGGGGGRAALSGVGSGGGGGGGLSQRLVNLVGVTSVTVTVGAGGLGSTVEGALGETGGTSSFGPYLSATGGIGGMGNAPSGSPNGPGNGGLGAGGDFNTTTGVGHPSYGVVGGSGGGAGGRCTQGPYPGNGGLGPGGGGSGAYYGHNGGPGAAGNVIIQW